MARYPGTRIVESAPEVERNGWVATVYNDRNTTMDYYVWVIYADVSS